MNKNLFFTLSIIFLVFTSVANAQNIGFEKDRHKQMLLMIKNDVKKNYFDPQLKGRDIEADYKTAVEKLDKAASIGQMSGLIAQFLVDFDFRWYRCRC